ncbi:MAG: hypothetical protein GEV05_00945 [Betaproteobacteria bacterium]|nr:hypothetical protein [Betaproteobacteria bacterium]
MKAACALAAFALLGIDCAQAQGWSSQKNVELVVPVAPGGTLDKLARGIERTFVASKVLNTSFTLVHRPGGGNQIGYNYWGDFFKTGAELHATIDSEYKAMKGVLVDLGLAKP